MIDGNIWLTEILTLWTGRNTWGRRVLGLKIWPFKSKIFLDLYMPCSWESQREPQHPYINLLKNFRDPIWDLKGSLGWSQNRLVVLKILLTPFEHHTCNHAWGRKPLERITFNVPLNTISLNCVTEIDFRGFIIEMGP